MTKAKNHRFAHFGGPRLRAVSPASDLPEGAKGGCLTALANSSKADYSPHLPAFRLSIVQATVMPLWTLITLQAQPTRGHARTGYDVRLGLLYD